MIWLGFAVLLGIAGAALAFAASRPAGASSKGRDPELEAYRGQLLEIDDATNDGRLSSEERETLRAEAGRRLLAASERDKTQTQAEGRSAIVILVVGVVVVLAAFAGYWRLGTPDRGVALSTENVENGDEAEPLTNPEIENAMTELREHLAATPEDIRGWQVMAQVGAELGIDADVANMLGEAIREQPDILELRVMQGEALIRVGDGLVSPAAMLAFLRILDHVDFHPAVHYYAGVERMQAGEVDAARNIWLELKERSAEDAPWLPRLEAQLSRIDSSQTNTSGASAGGGPVLSEDDMARVANMSPEERRAFIESMIDNLRGRLEANPDDVEGWLRLATAEQVIGRTGAAAAALVRALEVAPDDRKAEIEARLAALED